MMTAKLSEYAITKYLTHAAIIVAPIDIFNDIISPVPCDPDSRAIIDGKLKMTNAT